MATATIDSVLRRSFESRGGRLTLTLDPAFQGLPDTAHGGSVLAAFDALAALPGPRRMAGVYRKRVPLGSPLALAVGHDDGALTFVLSEGDAILVNGRVAPVADPDGGGLGSFRDPRRPGVAGPERADTFHAGSVASGVETGPRQGGGSTHALPVSRTCFACGVDNALGLRVRLEFDAAEVRGTWRPRAPFRTAEGALATAALTTLLDEGAFWLGALASGESGMTTDLAVTLHGSVPFGAAVTLSGARAAVRRRPDDARYWDTEVVVRTKVGTAVASARITFVAVRGAARRLVTGLLAMNDPDVLRRVFPSYAR